MRWKEVPSDAEVNSVPNFLLILPSSCMQYICHKLLLIFFHPYCCVSVTTSCLPLIFLSSPCCVSVYNFLPVFPSSSLLCICQNLLLIFTSTHILSVMYLSKPPVNIRFILTVVYLSTKQLVASVISEH